MERAPRARRGPTAGPRGVLRGVSCAGLQLDPRGSRQGADQVTAHSRTPKTRRESKGVLKERPINDAIIVGARCAGSALGLLLARRGYRILLVDRDTFPSDMPM